VAASTEENLSAKEIMENTDFDLGTAERIKCRTRKKIRLLLARKLNLATQNQIRGETSKNTARVRAPEQKEIEENEGT
jgi:hypothetical protein